jgi:hypothetical protein
MDISAEAVDDIDDDNGGLFILDAAATPLWLLRIQITKSDIVVVTFLEFGTSNCSWFD